MRTETPQYRAARSRPGFLQDAGIKLLVWAFYIGPALTIPLICSVRDRRQRWISIAAVVAYVTLHLRPGTANRLEFRCKRGKILIDSRRRDRTAGDPRAKIPARLNDLPGRQLAVVRYRSDHPALGNEWVYNAADIDNSTVVWARDMAPDMNRELLQYYHDRQVWLVEPDEVPPRLCPYRPELGILPERWNLLLAFAVHGMKRDASHFV